MSERVSVADAAKELGCAPQAIREMMKRGRWDLGEVIPPDPSTGKQFYSYFIYRPKLNRFLGKEEQANADNS